MREIDLLAPCPWCGLAFVDHDRDQLVACVVDMLDDGDLGDDDPDWAHDPPELFLAPAWGWPITRRQIETVSGPTFQAVL